MPTHLYCLLPARSELSLPPSVRSLRVGDLVAWVSDAAATSLSRDAREVARATVEHDRLIGAALAQGTTPVPSALADPYATDQDLANDVSAHAAAIERALATIEGRVEMTTIIAVMDPTPSADVAGSGRAYLEQIRSQPARAAAVAREVADALNGFGGGASQRAEGGRVAISHLVGRDTVAAYRSLALAKSRQGFRIVIDGPRAPYSFARFSPRHGILMQGPASAA